MLLFELGELTTRDESSSPSRFQDDVLRRDPLPEATVFDCPLLLPNEIHVAGALAYASCAGLGGLGLAKWALAQTLISSAARDEAQESNPPAPTSAWRLNK